MKLVIFDCDGTLIDSQDKIASSFERAFNIANIAWPGREATLKGIGLSLMESMRRLAPQETPEKHAELVEIYRGFYFEMSNDMMDNEPFYPGVREGLERLSRRDDLLLAIATGKSKRGLDRFVERENLKNMFVSLQNSDTAPSKPDPTMLLQAMDEAGGIRPENTIMVGDATYDIDMALAAGVTAIGVSWGYHKPQALLDAGARMIIDHFDELEAAIAE